MVKARQELGQHWLNDLAALKTIVDVGEIQPNDTVLEIGPGLGSLTKLLVEKAGKVIAIEKDEKLARNLLHHTSLIPEDGPPKGELEVVEGDILEFDLQQLPRDYKIVANIPYYLTSNLIRLISESPNPPSWMVLLVQKEVAQRLAAKPGQMSLLAVSAQAYWQIELGQVVPAELFEPPPKIDSQIVVFQRRQQPLFEDLDYQKFFRLVKAGFSERRKMLRSSLSAGLGISKNQAEALLSTAKIRADLRAQTLSLEDWYRLYSLV